MTRYICAAGFLLLIILLSSVAGATDAVLFFEHGHYWLELTFTDSAGNRIIPAELSTSNFSILDLSPGENPEFSPSRVKPDSSRMVVILSSGKLRGKRCYRVTYRENETDHIVFDRICDPFYFEPDDCRCKRFFARYVAPAFSSSGDVYELSRFSVAHEMSENRTDTEIYIQPEFTFGGWSLNPALEWDRVTYRGSGSYSARRVVRLESSYSKWFRELRYRIRVSYNHQLLSRSAEDDVIPRYSHGLTAALSVRLDHFLDGANRFCYSVFRGVDVGFGYTWYGSNNSEVWGGADFGKTTPFMEGRLTWTFLYGLQFSYSVISSFPSDLNDNFEEFHQFRFRLLLRGMLEPPHRRSYHPDLELAYDTGRRFPLFIREEKISLGFVFDMFPW